MSEKLLIKMRGRINERHGDCHWILDGKPLCGFTPSAGVEFVELPGVILCDGCANAFSELGLVDAPVNETRVVLANG